MAGAAPVRDDLAVPGVTSTFLWMIAFLDCSGISLTLVDEPQPAIGAMVTIRVMPREKTKPARERVLCHMFRFRARESLVRPGAERGSRRVSDSSITSER